MNAPNTGSPKNSTWDRHLTAFPTGCFATGAARGGHLVEKVILCNLVSPKSAAGEPNRLVLLFTSRKPFARCSHL
jgi:hypothetical protein